MAAVRSGRDRAVAGFRAWGCRSSSFFLRWGAVEGERDKRCEEGGKRREQNKDHGLLAVGMGLKGLFPANFMLGIRRLPKFQAAGFRWWSGKRRYGGDTSVWLGPFKRRILAPSPCGGPNRLCLAFVGT